jgi:CheY-like chemotaxis protein
VLVAEDNQVNQLVAAGILRGLGYAVDVVSDGEAAVAAVLGGGYDAVLMDCQMPGVDGFEATARIRLAERGRRTPIIALTASAMSTDRDRCLAAGMDDYVSKPVSMDAVETVLERWIPGPARERDEAPVPQATPAEPAGAPVLDAIVVGRLQSLGEAAGEDLFGQLTEIFLGELPGRLERLRDAAASHDVDALVRAAHALRGSSANIGASTLAGLCAVIEDGAPTGDDPAEPMAAVEVEVQRVSAALLESAAAG